MKRKRQLTDEEKHEMFEDMRQELVDAECAVLDDSTSGPTILRYCGRELGIISEDRYDEARERNRRHGEAFGTAPEGIFRSRAHALRKLAEEMERQKFWPNLYHVNDHGNVTLMDCKGTEICAWV